MEARAVAPVELCSGNSFRRVLGVEVEGQPVDLGAEPALEPLGRALAESAERSDVVRPDDDLVLGHEARLAAESAYPAWPERWRLARFSGGVSAAALRRRSAFSPKAWSHGPSPNLLGMTTRVLGGASFTTRSLVGFCMKRGLIPGETAEVVAPSHSGTRISGPGKRLTLSRRSPDPEISRHLNGHGGNALLARNRRPSSFSIGPSWAAGRSRLA